MAGNQPAAQIFTPEDTRRFIEQLLALTGANHPNPVTFPDFQDATNIRFDSTKEELERLENWKKKELEPWQNSTDTRLKDLYTNMVPNKTYDAEQKKVDDGMAKIWRNISDLTDASTAFSSELPSIKVRLGALEGEVNDLTDMMSGYDSKFKGYDEEFTKVRTEIKDGHDKLGKSMVNQGKEMNKGFTEILKKLGRNGDAKATPKIERPKNKTDKAPSDLSSGINVANYGQLSVQHAPNCTRFTDIFNSSNSTYCSCHTQNIFQPQNNGLGSLGGPSSLSPVLAYNDGFRWHGRLGSIAAPPSCYTPSSYSRRQRSLSSSEERSSNFNYTPNISIKLGRSGGSGLFSKSKTEEMTIGLRGGDGGGVSVRRRRREGDDGI